MRFLLPVFLLISWLSSSASALAQATSRPNVLILLADDLRHDALGCAGDKVIRTPHIDSLAKRGVRFRNGFVTTSICAVSRASILSGQYARRHQINDFATPFSNTAFASTYPMLLRAAGYRVGFIGKYGVGGAKDMPGKMFDYWKGFPGQGNYFDKGIPDHMNKRMADQALEFLKSHDSKTPFCLSMSFKCPHAQDRAPREFPPDLRDEELYKDVTFTKAKTNEPRYFEQMHDSVQKSESRTRWKLRFDTDEKYQAIVRDYYRLITGMDREIGRVLAQLESMGLLDNTLIVFTSDNGFFLGEHGLADKWYLYEESVRVPMIVAGPGVPAGKTSEAMVLNIDVLPTVLDYTKIAIPERVQGRSLRPVLAGNPPTDWRRDFFYEHYTAKKIIPPSEGVRTERWTYIRWMETSPVAEELYDLSQDALQERNLAGLADHSATLQMMRRRWEELKKAAE